MANHQRDPEKEAYWREVMERQRNSGLSMREFCRREGLSEPSLYAWRRTIARRDGSARPAKPRRSEPAFVPLVVKESPPRDTSIALELAGGWVLKFAGPMATEQLADLVIALTQRGER